ncbi:TlpA family protein disulfide reductase [Pedobacter mucosus]|uniref:TlpA family protein disulfide reductase n=1 Tax=Pedobacter mucosus TaxID=2895286 RepID=UPI001EE407CF|nr:thioredoxin family protein [Pedobacter mucosus]UKT64974.1 thioredoxin family protein [Pedobacter mucosus]
MLHDFGWPLIKTLYDKYKERGLKVVYFNNDDDEVRWKSHVEKNQLTWINVSEKQKFLESKIPKSFGIYAVPTCILVNANGKVTYNSDQEDTGLDKLEVAIINVI